jgi:hypothetical protein
MGKIQLGQLIATAIKFREIGDMGKIKFGQLIGIALKLREVGRY